MSTDDKFWSDYEQTSPNKQPAARWRDNDKAGLIPYVKDSDGLYKFLMMVASDPRFGGFKPMISKGTIEDGETTIQCAIREAVEEVGLRVSNCIGEPFEIFNGFISLRSVEYNLTVYAVEVTDKQAFDAPGSETKFTTWMSAESFDDRGRKDHQQFVHLLVERIDDMQPA